jgi:hypothetical protein
LAVLVGVSARLLAAAPRCGRRQRLGVQIAFPACWNGKALDSVDHRAHMAYVTRAGCPLSHPVSLPKLVLTVTYPTPGGRAVTLSSGPAATAHADLAISGVQAPATPPGLDELGTSLSGRVRQLNGRPLADVSLELAGHRTRTDANGAFAFTAIPAGHRVLIIDGKPANRANRRYGHFEAGVDLRARRANVLPYTIWMAPLDVRHEVRIPVPTRRETVITTPRIPGLELHLPAGTTVRDTSGRIVRRLGLSAIPVNKPPFPLPMLGVKAPIYFTAQPGGAYVLPKGARVIYPNYSHEPAGQRVEFWSYSPGRRGSHIYGHGRVTDYPPGPSVRGIIAI